MSNGVFAAGAPPSLLTVVDHASNAVPAGVGLGVAPDVLEQHIAYDIGAAALAKSLGFPRFLATVSRLVVDVNRAPDAPGLVPTTSDGVPIPGNAGARQQRFGYWRDYHARLEQLIADRQPRLLLSLHSFTPQLIEKPDEERPWKVGVLYNQDERAARVALPLLEAAGIVAGDQQPYSGRLLNYTMNRHAEANGIPYLGLEVRQDSISNEAGVAHWAGQLRPIILACLDAVS